MSHQCPVCSGPMEIRQNYLGDFWGCVQYPKCGGAISAKGTYMRAGQMAETEFDGRPLLPVVKVKNGEYRSKGGRFIIRYVHNRKGPHHLRRYWEAVDTREKTTQTGPSCVQLRFLLAGMDDTQI